VTHAVAFLSITTIISIGVAADGCVDRFRYKTHLEFGTARIRRLEARGFVALILPPLELKANQPQELGGI